MGRTGAKKFSTSDGRRASRSASGRKGIKGEKRVGPNAQATLPIGLRSWFTTARTKRGGEFYRLVG